MSGLKSCSEIFKYMHRSENRIFTRDGDGMVLSDGCLKADGTETVVSPFLFILLYFNLWLCRTNFNDFLYRAVVHGEDQDFYAEKEEFVA